MQYSASIIKTLADEFAMFTLDKMLLIIARVFPRGCYGVAIAFTVDSTELYPWTNLSFKERIT